MPWESPAAVKGNRRSRGQWAVGRGQYLLLDIQAWVGQWALVLAPYLLHSEACAVLVAACPSLGPEQHPRLARHRCSLYCSVTCRLDTYLYGDCAPCAA